MQLYNNTRSYSSPLSKEQKEFRFSVPNFSFGFGSALDLGSTLAIPGGSLKGLFRHYAELTPAELDAQALAGDWSIVGQDIEVAIEKFKQETSELKQG